MMKIVLWPKLNHVLTVGFKGMAGAECPGQCCGGHEGSMVVQDEGAFCPDDAIEEGDEGQMSKAGRGTRRK